MNEVRRKCGAFAVRKGLPGLEEGQGVHTNHKSGLRQPDSRRGNRSPPRILQRRNAAPGRLMLWKEFRDSGGVQHDLGNVVPYKGDKK